tara:strand:- start:187 stop:729 length:543 start_codon:yes stop_codon:yes gene_type:complete
MSTLKVDNLQNTSGSNLSRIIQHGQSIKTDTSSTANTSFTDISGLSVTLTPASTASKFYIDYNVNFAVPGSVYSGSVRLVKVVGGTTTDDFYVGDAAGNRVRTSNFTWSTNASYSEFPMYMFSGSLIHSPSTTSAVTFKLQFKSHYTNNFIVYVNRNPNDTNSDNHGRAASNLVVMELAA